MYWSCSCVFKCMWKDFSSKLTRESICKMVGESIVEITKKAELFKAKVIPYVQVLCLLYKCLLVTQKCSYCYLNRNLFFYKIGNLKYAILPRTLRTLQQGYWRGCFKNFTGNWSNCTFQLPRGLENCNS